MFFVVPLWFRHAINVVISRQAGVSIPVKVLFGIAVALVFQAILLPGRTVREGNMVVGNVVEEVDFLLLQHQGSSDGVNRSIAPALIEETTIAVQRIEVVEVGFGAQPVQVTDLEIGPLERLAHSPQEKTLFIRTKWQWL